MGIMGNWGATPPASNRMTRLGEQVFCESMAAAQGAPVPTATVLPSSRYRAATQIIISMVLYSGAISSSSFGYERRQSCAGIPGCQSVLDRVLEILQFLHPLEATAFFEIFLEILAAVDVVIEEL